MLCREILPTSGQKGGGGALGKPSLSSGGNLVFTRVQGYTNFRVSDSRSLMSDPRVQLFAELLSRLN